MLGVTVRRAWLVLGWVTVRGQVNYVGLKPAGHDVMGVEVTLGGCVGVWV